MMNSLIRCLVFVGLAGASLPVTQRAALNTEVWVFTGPWDSRSDSSLKANAQRLDVAVTGWIGLDSTTGQPILPSPYPDTMHLGGPSLKRMALVTSWHGDRFHPKSVRALAQDDRALARAAKTLAAFAVATHYAGLVLDLEGLERADLTSLLHVVKTITDSAHAHRISPIVVAIPAADSAAYPARPIAGVADLVMPMLYDQHWSTSGPGPISEPDWVRSTLAARVAEVGASRIVAALPLYGYQWPKSGTVAQDVTFAEAKRIAAESHVTLRRDEHSGTLKGVKPGAWEIWVTDADLLSTLVREVKETGVTRVALWRIGQEDPAIWRSIGR
jgi:spore germination protein YaaH